VIDVEVLTSLSELELIRAEWDELWKRCQPRTPFQRPEWILTWCRHFDCRSIWSPVVRREGRLVGIAPWLIYEQDARRLVAFMAGGVSDYHDILAEPNCIADVFEKMVQCLVHHRDEWDACDFEQLAPWSILRTAPTGSLFHETFSEGPPCPQLELPPLPVPVSTAVPKGQWARYAKYRRRAERQGSLALQEAGAPDIDAAWADVFRLHRARWQARGLAGALGEERLQLFHTAAARELGSICATVDRVMLDGRTIAGLYGFVIDRVKYCYLQGVDPECASLSPGLLMLGLILEDAQQRGIERIDFLRGAEPYKLAWGAKCSTNARRQLWLER
jgi:CelD/BcsL family acetyltransferase involved in cellulose biosynthesis